MSLLQQIKDDQLQARKEKNQILSSLLTTLIGEAAMIGKNDGNRESTDAEVVAVIKKFIKNIDESLKVKPDKVLPLEKIMLEGYLPKQLSEQELRAKINDHIIFAELKGMQSMGKVMSHLKQNYDGQYDGKLASQIVKELLS